MATARVPLPSRVFQSLLGQGFFDLVAPGLYVWGLTVAWPAAQKLAPWESRLLATAALVILLAGAGLSRFWPYAARMAGLWLFVGCSVGAWTLLGRSIAPTHLDPVHGMLGSVGWAAFAIVWGGERAPPDVAPSPRAALPWSEARRRTARVMTVVATAAAIPMALAWWVEGAERALLAHAVSLAAGIALLARGVELASPASRESGLPLPIERPQNRLLGAAWPLAALAGLALAGTLFALLR